jgi:hypothetical protein
VTDVYRLSCFFFLSSFSAVTLAVFQHLQCGQVGPARVLLSDPAVDCGSPDYDSLLVLVYTLLVLWVIGLPLALLILLLYLRLKNKMQDVAVADRWGFLDTTYTSRFFWVEPLALVRRVMIVSLAVLLLDHPIARSQALILSLLGLGLLQVTFRPYAGKVANRSETAAMLALMVLCVITNGYSIRQDHTLSMAAQAVVGLIVFSVTIVLVVLVLQQKNLSPQILLQRLRTWRGVSRGSAVQGPSARSSLAEPLLSEELKEPSFSQELSISSPQASA